MECLFLNKKRGKTFRVALINPPLSKGGFHHQIYLPMGLPYLAAVLEKNEHEIEVIDCEALEIDHKKLRAKLASLEPDVVGITSTTPTIESALLSAQVAKEACPNVAVVLGGPHATFMDEQILKEEAAVDIIVRGEGEQTLCELMDHIFNFEGLHEVAGITFRKNGQIIRTPNRSFIQNLDELPYPAYKYFPLKKYQISGRLILPVISSRGCPFQCSFCVSSQMFGKKFRMRRIKNVVDEIEWLRDTYGADAFTFYDDAFTLDIERAIEICEEIKRRKIGLPWNCQTRVDHVSKKLLAKMRESNCELVYFGVESGCQKILDAVGKETSIKQNEKAIKWAKDAGLVVIISLMIGYPGETADTLEQTLDLVRRLKPDDAYLCVATPYPGTRFYRLIEENGWEMSHDWSLYDTTTPVFENPSISKEKILEMRKKFVDDFYSPFYILRQMVKGNFYNRFFARIALSHLVWRIRSSL
jgi:anaerobic magnesium-protoporphyrin IX monomethyl ester cyclase